MFILKAYRPILIRIIIISTFLFLTTVSFGQNLKEQSFKIAVKDVILKLSKQDSACITKYIDARTGVYILYRIGIRDMYVNYKTFDFSNQPTPDSPFYGKAEYTTLKYETLPKFDCGNRTWSDTGTFVDTTITDHLLSKTAKWLVKNFDEEISKKTIAYFMALEQNSRRIIVAKNNESEVIFYLTYFNNKWYLTIIDKLTTDCSA
jgi:hypothetical protein